MANFGDFRPSFGEFARLLRGIYTSTLHGNITYNKYHRKLSAATTNLTSLADNPAVIGMLLIHNTSAAVKYVKFYDKASAPVLASDTPLFTFFIAAGTSLSVPVPRTGLKFNTGIAYAITGAVGDTDATAVAANDIILNINYA